MRSFCWNFFIRHISFEQIPDSGSKNCGTPLIRLRQSCHNGTLQVKMKVFETKNSLKTFSNPVFCRTMNGQMSASRQDCFGRFVKTAFHLSRGSFLRNICSKASSFINNLRLWAKNCRISCKICRQGLKNRNYILGVQGNILEKMLF